MRVNLASAGRFHIFDLARQMHRLGVFNHLYTAYPKWKVDGLDRSQVSTFPWLMIPSAFFGRYGWHHLQDALNQPLFETFDRWLTSRLESADIFHCLSGFGMRAHRVAKEQYGALTVCDRASSHILYQDEILAEEYERWQVRHPRIDRWAVDRELQEYAECDLITIPSTFVRRTFVEKGVPERKLVCVPYGVDLNLFRPLPKEDKVFRVIYAGALSLRKGIQYLLEALAPLNLPNFELWLIGGITDEIKPILARYEGHFRYLGFFPRSQLAHYYSQSSVFVMASIEEGLAYVQAQAMACGLPLIATTNTGGEDLIQNGREGFIVPIRDPQAIRERVFDLYENPAVRDEMAQAALKRVQSFGGWNTYGEQMLAAYQTALAQRN